jgi:hypothetical protein
MKSCMAGRKFNKFLYKEGLLWNIEQAFVVISNQNPTRLRSGRI